MEGVAKNLRSHDEAPSRAVSRFAQVRAYLDPETEEQSEAGGPSAEASYGLNVHLATWL